MKLLERKFSRKLMLEEDQADLEAEILASEFTPQLMLCGLLYII